MKAAEFITEESGRGTLSKKDKATLPHSAYTNDPGAMYRAGLMMAAAPNFDEDSDPYSFVSGRPFVIAFTPEEREMIKAAFKKLGLPFNEFVNDESHEPEGINTKSITSGFKGY